MRVKNRYMSGGTWRSLDAYHGRPTMKLLDLDSRGTEISCHGRNSHRWDAITVHSTIHLTSEEEMELMKFLLRKHEQWLALAHINLMSRIDKIEDRINPPEDD